MWILWLAGHVLDIHAQMQICGALVHNPYEENHVEMQLSKKLIFRKFVLFMSMNLTDMMNAFNGKRAG